MKFNAIVPKMKAIAKLNIKASGKKSNSLSASRANTSTNRINVTSATVSHATHDVAAQMPTVSEVAAEDSQSKIVGQTTACGAESSTYDKVLPGLGRNTDCSSTSVRIAVSNTSPASDTAARLTSSERKNQSLTGTTVEVQVEVAVKDAHVVPAVVALERVSQFPSHGSLQVTTTAQAIELKPIEDTRTTQTTRVAINVTLPAEVACVQPSPATAPVTIVTANEASSSNDLSKLQIVAVISGMMWTCWRMTFWPDPVAKRRTSAWKQAAFGAGAILLPILLVLVVCIGIPSVVFTEVKGKIGRIGNVCQRKLQSELNDNNSLQRAHTMSAAFGTVPAK